MSHRTRFNIGTGLLFRGQEDETMEELEVAVDALSQHVAMLEGIIDVMLQEAENGTLERAAASIRSALLHGDSD
jgi:hypothetical protein